MKTTSSTSAQWLLLLLVVGACAGTRLNDVGDVDGEGGEGSGGTSTTGAPTTAGGKPWSGGTPATTGSTATTTGGNVGGTHTGGSPDEPPLTGEAGWPSYDGELECATCEELAVAPDIRALWLTSDRVYWTEFGTSDALGNYQDDGRLMSLSLSGGTPVEVATGLQGPTWLALGELYAYVWQQRSSAPQGMKQLARISLDSGDVEVIQPFREGSWIGGVDLARRMFAFGGGYAHWWVAGTETYATNGKVFRLAEDEGGSVEELPGGDRFLRLSASEDNLYVHDDEGIRSFPIDGGASQQLLTSDAVYDPMVVVGTDFFGVELRVGPPHYTVKLPLTGGAVRRLGKNTNDVPDRIVTDGSRFVGSVRDFLIPERLRVTLVDGDLADSGAARPLASVPPWTVEGHTTAWTIRAWDANATDIYLGYGDRLYRIRRPESSLQP